MLHKAYPDFFPHTTHFPYSILIQKLDHPLRPQELGHNLKLSRRAGSSSDHNITIVPADASKKVTRRRIEENTEDSHTPVTASKDKLRGRAYLDRDIFGGPPSRRYADEFEWDGERFHSGIYEDATDSGPESGQEDVYFPVCFK
jgi:hypothetical protein